MLELTHEQLVKSIDTPLFHTISEVADSLGLECYVIGGFVRDLFLGRPSGDVDVVVVGSGIKVAEALCAKLGRGAHLAVFRRFGTAQVKWHGMEVEFVGARSESYSDDSRKPAVEEGTLEDDQRRRDFTINVLALCLNADRWGELSDPFYGLDDMRDRLIRTPLDPDITFSDDPLRMMRCVRFATQLGFQIYDETFEALERNAERIKIVSAERIVDELDKIMLAAHPSVGLDYLQRSRLMKYILPELSALDMQETKGKFSYKNNFYHTLEVVENVCRAQERKDQELKAQLEAAAPDSDEAKAIRAQIDHNSDHRLWLRWAALLHDVGKTATKQWNAAMGWTFKNHNVVGARLVKVIFRRLKLPMDERMKYVRKLVELHMRPIAIADDEVTDSAVRRLLFDAGDDIDDLMTLCEADITSRNRVRKQTFLNNFKLVRRRLKEIEERDRIRNFQPPVDGVEIMNTFGIGPCREVGELKSLLKDAVLEGEVPNEHDAVFKLMLEKAAAMGLKPIDESKQ